jgi:S1-C subfamily serine protease
MRWFFLLSALAGLCVTVGFGFGQVSVASSYAVPDGVRIEVEHATGSGVHLHDGFYLTAAHVVENYPLVDIIRNDVRASAEVLWRNETYDIALLYGDPIAPTTLTCEDPPIGATVDTIGNPFGFRHVLTRGFVAAPTEKRGDWKAAYLVNIVSLPGNSGGPLFYRNMLAGIVVGGLGARTPVGAIPITGLTIVVSPRAICQLLAR